MDKFFIALIGVFVAIFAYLKIQLSFARKKAQKALSESARTSAEKESIENYASVLETLSKRLDSLDTANPAESQSSSDTPLKSGASALDTGDALSENVQNLSHEQLARLRQLKGL